MTVNEAWEFCQSLARKEGNNGRFSPAEFNSWATFSQRVAISERLPKVHTDDAAREQIDSLLKEKLVEVKGGAVAVPVDTMEIDSMATPEGHEVDILPPAKFEKRRHSALKGPEPAFPIARQMGESYLVLPADLAQIRVYYFRKPKPVKWAYVAENGGFVFKEEGSQGFEVNETLHEEICIRILLYAGINLSNELLVQYGLQHLRPTPNG